MDKKRLGEVRNMKRMKICLSAAILFCFILTGCGQADENETVKSQVTQEETPVYTSSEEKVSEGVEEIYPQTSEKQMSSLKKIWLKILQHRRVHQTCRKMKIIMKYVPDMVRQK